MGEEGLVLGITGGFHTPALAEYLREQTKLKEWKEQAKRGREGIYLMPYSMEGDRRLGRLCQRYAFSRLYQRIWEKLEENKEKEQPQKGVYEGAVLDFLIETGRDGRKRTAFPTTYDEICALDQARGLASLRDKRDPEPGN